MSLLCIRWPRYWSFSISLSNEYSGLISYRRDSLDLLVVQEILKSLFQHHSSKASILQPPAFFIVQLSHAYMTTGKTIALTRWTFIGKVMSLLFNKRSCLENPMDGGAWWAAQSCLTLCHPTFTFTFHFHALEKEMATHSMVLAWRIPGMGEPVGLPSMGSHRVGHN